MMTPKLKKNFLKIEKKSHKIMKKSKLCEVGGRCKVGEGEAAGGWMMRERKKDYAEECYYPDELSMNG